MTQAANDRDARASGRDQAARTRRLKLPLCTSAAALAAGATRRIPGGLAHRRRAPSVLRRGQESALPRSNRWRSCCPPRRASRPRAVASRDARDRFRSLAASAHASALATTQSPGERSLARCGLAVRASALSASARSRIRRYVLGSRWPLGDLCSGSPADRSGSPRLGSSAASNAIAGREGGERGRRSCTSARSDALGPVEKQPSGFWPACVELWVRDR